MKLDYADRLVLTFTNQLGERLSVSYDPSTAEGRTLAKKELDMIRNAVDEIERSLSDAAQREHRSAYCHNCGKPKG